MIRLNLLILALLAGAGNAAAAPTVIRMATVAPDGTAWAREIRAFTREVENGTRGEVRFKWYFGGIAGSEMQVGQRIERNQLDGAASGGMLCQDRAPSMRVMRVQGVFHSRDEGAFVLGRLAPLFADEFRAHHFVMLTVTGMGPEVVLSREPIRSMDDLRRLTFWRWDIDEIGLTTGREMGIKIVPLPLEEAARAFDDRKVDGFFAIPAAALAFQWFSRALHLTALNSSYLWGCLIVSDRVFGKLPIDQQQVMRAAGAKIGLRFEEVGRQQDDALLGGLFARQGVTPQPMSESFRTQFFAAARGARDRLGAKLVAPDLLQRVLALLADYRAEHPVK